MSVNWKSSALVAIMFLLCITCAKAAELDAGTEQLVQFIDVASKIEKKTEFETAADYAKRVDATYGGHEFTIVVPAIREGYSFAGKLMAYDAEKKTLTVKLIGQTSIELLKVFDMASPDLKKIFPQGFLPAGAYAKFYLKKTAPKVTKEYEGGNAYGAKAKIQVVQSTEWAVAISNLPESMNNKAPEHTIEVDADKAKAIVTNAKWRLTLKPSLVPAQKQIVLDDGMYKAPTVQSPVELAVTGKTMMAALMKAELLLGDDVVLTFGEKK